jgi:hypothetical protein
MKYFIGAKDKNGIAFIADMIDAKNFDDAYDRLIDRANAEKPSGDYRITACNEMPADMHTLFERPKTGDKPAPRWSMLKIVDSGAHGDDVDIDIQVAHSRPFESAEEAQKSPAAKLISVAARFLNANLDGTITEDTKVRDFFREQNAKPLIVLPDSPEVSRE